MIVYTHTGTELIPDNSVINSVELFSIWTVSCPFTSCFVEFKGVCQK